AGLAVVDVATVTGAPGILDGRVKTLHPSIHAAILARRDQTTHMDTIAAMRIAPIDLVVVNLYPFEATAAKGAAFDACIENIDIGGPALIRAAAKNHDFVAVVTDPADYEPLMADIAANDGAVSADLKKRLAAAAYARTGAYDAAISEWFARDLHARAIGEEFPQRLVFGGTLRQALRYGENPHQRAAFYTDGCGRPGVATAMQLQGKELSFNNLNDADAAYELVAEFDRPAIVIVKHANPCGVATADTAADAWEKALACDPVSAFGGIVALNRALDGAAAARIAEIFSEVIIAPEADDAAKAILAKKKNLRLLLTGRMPDPRDEGRILRSLSGGYLVQSRDRSVIAGDLKVVTKRLPTKTELADLMFAFTVCKHVKSNAIVYARDRATVGIGAGQMSRVDSARIAVSKAAEAAKAAGKATSPVAGSVVASDAFFPFADGLLAAAEAGATAVIQPGGSVRDDEVIAAADAKGLAMVFTGQRHFRH
ncbi:MAG: bifunctional phosphoribosylaminoimidazolecarboxamide formyltransferase/IMP cyclohydrolase, partial [Alphaproteobacteria bacterium]